MSTHDLRAIERRLTPERIRSYLRVSDQDLSKALELYDWNARLASTFHEDLGRLEVLFRNTLDEAMTAYAALQDWNTPWYQRRELFPGRSGGKTLRAIQTARDRAMAREDSEIHGKVIAELNFGFWRYLCSRSYFTSMWVPAIASAFPNHPSPQDFRRIHEDVEHRMQQLHFLRNRVAHHEPLHLRDLTIDVQYIQDLAYWICVDSRAWIDATSRVSAEIRLKPAS